MAATDRCSPFGIADERFVADGEVVWSWHPDAGVTLAPALTRRAGNGGQKARRTEESAKQPSKPSRGECRVALG